MNDDLDDADTVLEPTATEPPLGRPPVNLDPAIAKLPEVESNGVKLHTVPFGPTPAHRLPPEEFAARMAALTERVAVEEAEAAADLDRCQRRGRKLKLRKPERRPKLRGDVLWLDLRVVNCRWCRRVCLAPCDEPFRAEHKGREAYRSFPMPVGKVVTETYFHGAVPTLVDFYVCKKCVQG